MSDLFPERVETDRLVLERLSTGNVDVLEFYRHCSRRNPTIEEVTEHLSWEPHATPKETLEFVESQERAWAEGEDAAYVIRPKPGEDGIDDDRSSEDGADDEEAGEDGTGEDRTDEDGSGVIAGGAGLHPHWERRTATLGTWLRKPFWGRGYSGERAAALMEVAFDRLDIEVVAVSHHEGNDQSRRAIEKYVERFGGQREGLLRNGAPGPGGPVDLHRYTVTREQWTEATKGD